ncbi:hypothetical protein ACLB2K_016822 [Fragaria x ananassa]
MVQLCRKIKDLGKSLLTWDRAVFKGRRRELEEVRLAMQTLLQKPHNDSDQSEKLQLCQRLNELMSIDEVYWRQRSRAIWLKDGDRNSKFFHKSASNRRKKNKLKGLYDRQGVWQNTPQGIEEVVISYFQDLFARQEPDLVAQNTVLQTIQPRVTSEMNQTLLAPYSMEEVKVALFQMHPSKAPGPDGMSPFFFQKYWDLVGAEVSNAVISFLTTKDMPHDLNFTNVVLIPKVKEVQYMTELHTIALCNVVYKIASKVLANKLKTFLPKIVSLEQSAFVPIRYSFMINGIAKGFVTPHRGLRQGDPISPYLFLLCVEGLSALIANSVEGGKWKGLQEVASGQQVNLQKSSVVFSGSVLPDSQRSLAEELGMQDEDLRMFRSPDLNKVSDLFLSPRVWNVNLLQELFPRHIVSKILAFPISSRGHHDRWLWSEDKKGKFTVKSAYHLARKPVLDHEVTPNPSSLL